jgi:serine/threonine-protein kinase
MARSKEYLEHSIAVDPSYALAWQGLGLYYWWLGFLGFMPPKEANLHSNQASKKALELDETLAEAHSLMALLRAGEFDWRGAELEFLRALTLDPLSVESLANYSEFYLVPMRRLDEAVASAQKAVEMDPLSPLLQWHLGQRYWFMREYDSAIRHFGKALEIDPQYHWAHLFVGAINIHRGNFDEGIRACEIAVQIVQRRGISLGVLGWAYARAGRVSEAHKILEEMQNLRQKSYVSPSNFAWIYLALGEIDAGFNWMENAVDERDHAAAQVHVHPDFIALHSHPRYHALLRKMNLIDAPMAH